MGLTTYPFTLRSPDGREYRISVPATTESEAQHILENVLDSLQYRDRIVTPAPQTRASFARSAGKRNYHLFNWADKSTIYRTKQSKDW